MAGEAGQANYAAAKAGVAALIRSLAAEFAPVINVNCISAALIQTSAVERMPAEQIRCYVERTLLKRLGRAEDIANAAVFLASDEAAYITGENLYVSGGINPAL
ncbi:SDR family oxidoreductase [Ferrovibrio sp.]|uniref:SDR family oxidoreductase n=1 Tax=Ferrovibrio sp. TaxID=1917215 RepID=UPI00262E49C9|nr:SDR family oxidoreductase [Ferrovibrio sp.]